jgi:hypothetical protein
MHCKVMHLPSGAMEAEEVISLATILHIYLPW